MENYAKIKLLGEGSFGKVFLMREKKPGGRLVCVKQIHSVHHPSNSSVTVMEAQLMRKLSHPNLIRFLDAFPSSAAPGSSKRAKQKSCIVMEFCSGGDLRAYLQKHRSSSNGDGGRHHHLTEDLVWFWFLQLCLGLHHMHQLQILHRDIKTANIFLSNAGFLVLGDFGIARELSSAHEMASTVIGTPLYMAPETLEGKPYSFASDIWSLGCVLYEVCTGDPPFVAKSTPALINRICEGRFAPLSRTKLSSRLQDLLSAMLRVDAAARPTAASILKDPGVHARLKRYFHDRYTISSSISSNTTKIKQEEQAILTRQLQSLGVTVNPTPLEANPGNHGSPRVNGGGGIGSKSSERENSVEAKLAVEREHERRQQLLVALDQLQRLRLQKELPDPSNEKEANRRATVKEFEQHGEVIAQDLNRRPRSPVFPQFRSVPKDAEREICWRDPVQNCPRSSDRDHRQQQKHLETPRKTNFGGASTSASFSSFLGVPRKGVPLTTQAKEFASQSPICKDVRVLRKRESAKAAEKYKQGLEVIKPLKAPAVKESPVMQRAQRCRPMTDEQMDDAISHSIEELQSALSAMR